MTRAAWSRSLGVLLLVALAAPACRGREMPDLSPEEAGQALRSSPNFTTRPGTPVGRELIDVLAVRRIGRSSIEVEFTWRDAPAPAGQSPAVVRTSMALFRVRDDATWGLSSLYKVN